MTTRQVWKPEEIFDGKATRWTSTDYQGWQIFEQPAGFYLWRGYTFAGEFTSLVAAWQHVKVQQPQHELEQAVAAYDRWVLDDLEITPDSDHARDSQDASDAHGLMLLHRLAKTARATL